MAADGMLHSLNPCAVPLRPRLLVHTIPVRPAGPAVPPSETNGVVAAKLGLGVGCVIVMPAGPVGAGPVGMTPGRMFASEASSPSVMQAVAPGGRADNCAAFSAASVRDARPAAKF